MEGFNCTTVNLMYYMRYNSIYRIIKEALTDLGSNRPTAYSASSRIGERVDSPETFLKQLSIMLNFQLQQSDYAVCQSMFNASTFCSARNHYPAFPGRPHTRPQRRPPGPPSLTPSPPRPLPRPPAPLPRPQAHIHI